MKTTVLSSFNWIDWAIVGLLFLSVLISLIRGFVKEALSLASWTLAFLVALAFHTQMAVLLESLVERAYLRDLLAYALLFLGTLIAGTLVTWLISELVRRTGLSGTDRLLGSVFGLARGGVLVLALVMVLPSALEDIEEDAWWQESQLIPHFQLMTDWSERAFAELSGWVAGLWDRHRESA